MAEIYKRVYVAYGDLSATLEQWELISGIPKTTIFERLRRRWSIEEAIVSPKFTKKISDTQELTFTIMKAEKGIRKSYKRVMDAQQKIQERIAKAKEAERRAEAAGLMSAKRSKNLPKIEMTAKYRITHFKPFSSHSGRWVTEVVSGSELYELLNTKRHTIERWEEWKRSSL